MVTSVRMPMVGRSGCSLEGGWAGRWYGHWGVPERCFFISLLHHQFIAKFTR